MSEELLRVKDLRTSFFTHLGEVKAMRGISFGVNRGQVLGIVGESGSGKSVTSLSVMGLLQFPGKVVGREILFCGQNLLSLPRSRMRAVRGKEISMIFQDPMTSLNPVYTVGSQITEMIRAHERVSKAEARRQAIEMLSMVGIPAPEDRVDSYPHEFSGGMRQRVMIAMALACRPKLLIADEPTTALDVTIQAQILSLIRRLNDQFSMTTILITHDLGVVAKLCDRIAVMYGGLIMEEGSAKDIFYNPCHPYTMGLLESIPSAGEGERGRLKPIPGTPPSLIDPPAGCPFSARCPHCLEICQQELPPFFEAGEGHRCMCWMLHEGARGADGEYRSRREAKRRA